MKRWCSGNLWLEHYFDPQQAYLWNRRPKNKAVFFSVIWKVSFPIFFDHHKLNLFHFPHQIWATSQLLNPLQISWKLAVNGPGAEYNLPSGKIHKS